MALNQPPKESQRDFPKEEKAPTGLFPVIRPMEVSAIIIL